MRVLIVDDSAFMRRMLTRVLESNRNLEVVGTARNGAEAVAKCAELDPDVVTMDVEMPEMNGLEALRAIRAAHGPLRPAVVMCSTLTDCGSRTALEALRLGASEVIAKEEFGTAPTDVFQTDLVNKIRAVGTRARGAPRSAVGARPPAIAAAAARPASRTRVTPDMIDLIAIGSSTGGPPVLETIVGALRIAPTRPILIAQHMPSLFTKSLASRLNEISGARVTLAVDGTAVEAGTVYVAEGGRHLRVRPSRSGLVLEVSPEPAGALYKPAVNELFSSVAHSVGGRALGIVLTGMGDDGLEGARLMKEKGALLVAQDEASSVVYGMPRAITEAGLASASLPPAAIAGLVAEASGGEGDATDRRRSA